MSLAGMLRGAPRGKTAGNKRQVYAKVSAAVPGFHGMLEAHGCLLPPFSSLQQFCKTIE
jgi:hypothetical protein